MKVVHYIAARQTGKTSKAIELFREHNSPTTYMVVADGVRRRHDIVRRSGVPINQILTPNPDSFRGRMISTLIVDDFLLVVKQKIMFWTMLQPALIDRDAKVFLLSTPNKKYTQRQLNESYYCLRSNNDVEVIDTVANPIRHNFRRINYEEQMQMRNFFTKQDQFDCEMLGMYMVGQEFHQFYIPKPRKLNKKYLYNQN